MRIACLDLEGVLVPEIWVNVAEATGIDDLRLTTRDIADYDELMTHRLRVLDRHGLGIEQIQTVIADLSPLEGAKEFLEWLRSRYQVIILSDTFYQFADPLMAQLGRPTLFAHDLIIDSHGKISGYQLRLKDQKRKAIEALRLLNFTTLAAGDSYNDLSMLKSADAGVLFCPPQNLIAENPSLPVAHNYEQLAHEFTSADEWLG